MGEQGEQLPIHPGSFNPISTRGGRLYPSQNPVLVRKNAIINIEQKVLIFLEGLSKRYRANKQSGSLS